MKQIYIVFLFILSFNTIYAKDLLLPTATISGGTTICQNSSGSVITFTGSGGVAPYTFTYRINGSVPVTIITLGTNSSVTLPVNTSAFGTFNYTLESVSDSSVPVQSAAVSGVASVNIIPQANANMGGTGSGSTFNGIPVFRVCTNSASQFTFTNTSSTPALNSNYTINWGDGSPDFTGTSWASLNHTYQVGLWNLVYTITASNGCNVTKNYTVFVGSNPAVSLGNPGNTDICNANSLTFPITGTTNNPPGTTYTVTFNDGSAPQVFNHPPPPNVTHSFLASSCGTTSSDGSNSYPNSFSANIVATNPCSTSSVGVVPIYVSANPQANFTGPTSGCTSSQICFTNTSSGRQVIGGTCSNPPIVWSVSPSTGYSIVGGGSLGNDFSLTDSSLWMSGSNNLCLNFSVAGTYTITIKTGNKCGFDVEMRTICIESPLTPTFTLNATSGCAPLSITANNTTVVTNSCTPPTYVWNIAYASGNCGTSITPIPNANTTNATYNFIEAGIYTIKLTGTNSCGSFSTTQIVTVKSPPTITAINGILASYCGTATINPTAAVNACAPSSVGLNYAWSFPGGTPSTSSLPTPGAINYATSGNHTVSLIVSNECGASTTFTKMFVINDVPVLTTAPLSQTICSGTATTLVNLTSNLPGTIFTWTATATSGITGFAQSGTTNTIPIRTITTTSSSSGTITYVITPSINGCIGIPSNYVINVNPAPSIITQPASSTVCQGGTPAILMVALSSTSGSPTYQWYSNTSNNTTTGTIIPGETNPTFSPPANTIGTTYYYCIIALTSGGCSIITSSVATVIIANAALITNQPLATQNLCVGSTIATPLLVTYSGGTGTPNYQWYFNSTNSTTGGTLISGAVNATYTPPAFTSPGSNYYYVVITLGGNSCGNLISAIGEIIVNNDPTIATQPLSPQTVCQGAISQNLEVIMTDMTGMFSYQWYSNNANNTTSGTSISGANASTYLPPTTIAGTRYYYCIITQNGITGCNVTSAIASVITNSAPNLTTQPISNTLCLGQTTSQLNLAYANGSGTAQYQWYSNTVNSNIGGSAIASANSANYAPNVTSAGTLFYYCIITFPALPGGCNTITSNVAEITVKPKPVVAPQSPTICSGAIFAIIPNNSTGDVVPTGTTYTWSNPIVNPAGAVTGASFQSIPQTSISQTLINTITSPATVTYTVTPTVGTCSGTSFTVIVTVNPSTNPNAMQSNITCFGANNGSITTNITGGIPFATGAPYIIVWTGPNGFTSSDSNITSLSPGLYNLSITDAGGCPISTNYTIVEPNDIIITTDVNSNITCFGSTNGAIAITVSGGTGAYNYTWTKNGLPFSTTEDISNLGAGDYILSVTDANNCGPKTEAFTITEPPVLNVTLANQTNVNCFGDSTGAITINAVGGTIATDYSYAWSGPNGFTSSNQNLTNLLAGTYNLNLTDDLGCTKNLAVIITQSTPIIITAVTTPIVCYGDNNATISVSITGGNLPYQIQWSNLAVGLNQDNLAPGDYKITVTDGLGCQKEAVINIPSPPIFTVNPVVSNISCFGAHDGSIVLNFVGGIAPINLVWSDGSPAGITRNNLGPGTYSVTITDSKPCTITRNFTILEPQPLVLSANITNALNCSDANSGAIDLLVSGGTPPFTYSWNNGMTTEDLSNIPAGNYAVTVTDSRLCTKMTQYSVTRPNPMVLSVNTTTNANCNTQTVTQNFATQISGGVPPYQFNWSSGTVTGANNEFMTTTQDGLIVLTATDAIGCTAIYSLNVDIPIIGNSDFSASSIGSISYGIYAVSDPIEFTSTIIGDYTNVLWDFGDGTFSNELNPTHIYSIPKNYLVTQTVTYPFGCVYVNRLSLSVEKGYLLVVPTAFTPGDDGINDTFRPVTKGLKNIRLDIYDTLGSLIYSEVGDVIKGWDGKIKGINSENGNYYSKVSAETFYGRIVNSNQTLVLIK